MTASSRHSVRLLILPILLALVAGHPGETRGQIISPGPLSTVHRSLEGIGNCTSCHKLGQRGASATACLDCHVPLASRIREQRGYHSGIADRNCADCHREHLGLDFDMVRLDTTAFDHDPTGYTLAGSHRAVPCRDCHRPDFIADVEVREFKSTHGRLEQTFLGVSSQCGTCHLADSPHKNQFAAQDCDSCHGESTWDGAERFDHDDARFALRGRHASTECVKCHPGAAGEEGAGRRFRGLEFESCTSCHSDPHRGLMGARATCNSCHTEEGWHEVSRRGLRQGFDHSRTGFPLLASHATLECDACHASPAQSTSTIDIRFMPGTARQAFPKPASDSCDSCHRDVHAGQLRDGPTGGTCSSCHTEAGWQPPLYDIERHNRESDFRLTGAHLATPCSDCHRPDASGGRTRFEFGSFACMACHAKSDVHRGRFGDPTGEGRCEACHSTASWRAKTEFDHSRTSFTLSGRHKNIPCESCHGSPGTEARRLHGLEAACSSCHRDVDPHRGQFASSECSRCHDSVSFRIASFDHSLSSFKLSGAHQNVACASCHRQEEAEDGELFVRFKPLSGDCATCHSEVTR